MAASITEEDANKFIQDILGLENFDEELRKDRLGALNDVIRGCFNTLPFHNLHVLLQNPGERRIPSQEESIKMCLSGEGGLCWTLNTFLKNLLTTLGYNTHVLMASVSSPSEHNHVALLIRDVVQERDVFTVDLGFGSPCFEAVPLDFEKRSPVYRQSFCTYRYEKRENHYVRLHKKSQRPNASESPYQKLVDGWYESCFFSLDPADETEAEKLMDRLAYADPNSCFHKDIRLLSFRDSKAFAMKNECKLIEDDQGILQPTEVTTDEEILTYLQECVPNMPMDKIKLGVSNWRKDDKISAELLTQSDAADFLKESLHIEDIDNKLKSRNLSFLNEIIKGCVRNIPYHNIWLLTAPPDKRSPPSPKACIERCLNGHGGLSWELNCFLYYLIKALGYSAQLISASAHAPDADDHVAVLVRHLLNEGDMYIVDIGLGCPVDEAACLDFEKESREYRTSLWRIKFGKHGGRTWKLMKSGDKLGLVCNEVESLSQSDADSNLAQPIAGQEWRHVYSFQPMAVEVSSILETVDVKVYKNKALPVHRELSVRRFNENGKMTGLKGETKWFEDEDGRIRTEPLNDSDLAERISDVVKSRDKMVLYF